jgi:hypothetical protein
MQIGDSVSVLSFRDSQGQPLPGITGVVSVILNDGTCLVGQLTGHDIVMGIYDTHISVDEVVVI